MVFRAVLSESGNLLPGDFFFLSFFEKNVFEVHIEIVNFLPQMENRKTKLKLAIFSFENVNIHFKNSKKLLENVFALLYYKCFARKILYEKGKFYNFFPHFLQVKKLNRSTKTMEN